MDRMNYMCSEFLSKHVHEELDLLHDAFSELMKCQPYVAVTQRRSAEAEKIFKVGRSL